MKRPSAANRSVVVMSDRGRVIWLDIWSDSVEVQTPAAGRFWAPQNDPGWRTARLTANLTGMATANLTVSLDPVVIAMAKAQAAQAGMPASAWVAKLIRDATVAEASRRYDEFNRQCDDQGPMAVWDSARIRDDDERLAGAEW